MVVLAKPPTEGRIMLLFLFSSVWAWRTGMFPLSDFDCSLGVAPDMIYNRNHGPLVWAPNLESF